jgi:hypothetical protein
MTEDELWEKSEQLVTEIYGEGSPISEEEMEGLIRGLQRERSKFARGLVKAIELTGLSLEQLTVALTANYDGDSIIRLDPRWPEIGVHYLERLNWACEELHKKGYGDRLPGLLQEPIIEDFLPEDPKISILEAVRNGLDPMRTLVFLKSANEPV